MIASPPTSPQERAIAHVAALAEGTPIDESLRITLHFHPDRLAAGGPLLRVMARDGFYRSQFETGTSNGGGPPPPVSTSASSILTESWRPPPRPCWPR